MAIPIVTTLPAAPTDGDQVKYLGIIYEAQGGVWLGGKNPDLLSATESVEGKVEFATAAELQRGVKNIAVDAEDIKRLLGLYMGVFDVTKVYTQGEYVTTNSGFYRYTSTTDSVAGVTPEANLIANPATPSWVKVGNTVFTQDDAPTTFAVGDFWFDTDTGYSFIAVLDAASTPVWADIDGRASSKATKALSSTGVSKFDPAEDYAKDAFVADGGVIWKALKAVAASTTVPTEGTDWTAILVDKLDVYVSTTRPTTTDTALWVKPQNPEGWDLAKLLDTGRDFSPAAFGGTTSQHLVVLPMQAGVIGATTSIVGSDVTLKVGTETVTFSGGAYFSTCMQFSVILSMDNSLQSVDVTGPEVGPATDLLYGFGVSDGDLVKLQALTLSGVYLVHYDNASNTFTATAATGIGAGTPQQVSVINPDAVLMDDVADKVLQRQITRINGVMSNIVRTNFDGSQGIQGATSTTLEIKGAPPYNKSKNLLVADPNNGDIDKIFRIGYGGEVHLASHPQVRLPRELIGADDTIGYGELRLHNPTSSCIIHGLGASANEGSEFRRYAATNTSLMTLRDSKLPAEPNFKIFECVDSTETTTFKITTKGDVTAAGFKLQTTDLNNGFAVDSTGHIGVGSGPTSRRGIYVDSTHAPILYGADLHKLEGVVTDVTGYEAEMGHTKATNIGFSGVIPTSSAPNVAHKVFSATIDPLHATTSYAFIGKSGSNPTFSVKGDGALTAAGGRFTVDAQGNIKAKNAVITNPTVAQLITGGHKLASDGTIEYNGATTQDAFKADGFSVRNSLLTLGVAHGATSLPAGGLRIYPSPTSPMAPNLPSINLFGNGRGYFAEDIDVGTYSTPSIGGWRISKTSMYGYETGRTHGRQNPAMLSLNPKTGATGFCVVSDVSTDVAIEVRLGTSSIPKLRILSDGTVGATGNVVTSDPRLKTNWDYTHTPTALADFRNLEIGQYDWIDDDMPNAQFGFNAESLHNLAPQCATLTNDPAPEFHDLYHDEVEVPYTDESDINEDGSVNAVQRTRTERQRNDVPIDDAHKIKGVSVAPTMALMAKMIHELTDKLEAAEARLAKLEKKE